MSSSRCSTPDAYVLADIYVGWEHNHSPAIRPVFFWGVFPVYCFCCLFDVLLLIVLSLLFLNYACNMGVSLYIHVSLTSHNSLKYLIRTPTVLSCSLSYRIFFSYPNTFSYFWYSTKTYVLYCISASQERNTISFAFFPILFHHSNVSTCHTVFVHYWNKYV